MTHSIGQNAAVALRKRAEAQLANSKIEKVESPEQSQKLIHELLIHQIELEMQNEELRRIQSELEAVQKRYFDLYNNAPVSYLSLTEDGLILDGNLTAAQLFSVDYEDLIGKSITQFIWPDDLDLCYIRRKALFKTGLPQEFQLRLKSPEPDHFWAGIMMKQVVENGKPVCLAMIRDVSERKEMEWALIEAKEAAEAANTAKNQFLAVLSHELRNPLTPVLATVSALEIKEDLPEELRADMTLIRQNVEIEVALINDLLDVTRIDQGKMVLQEACVDINQCLKTALEICKSEIQKKQLKIHLELQAPQHHVCGDPIRLNQVFWNLLKNAVKFTPEGGMITLHTKNIENLLRVQINDTGIGITSDLMPHIFNPFEQGKQSRARQFGGLGLGLHIARTVLEHHKGRLTAQSDGKNQGTTFTVELDWILKPEPIQPIQPEVQSNDRFLKILIAEDNEDNLKILVKLLKTWGHTPTPAANVKTALQLIDIQEFDLLITDLGLPDGSGIEILHALKKNTQTPGIALSGFGTKTDIKQSLAAGFSHHIVKPFNLVELKNTIQQIALR